MLLEEKPRSTGLIISSNEQVSGCNSQDFSSTLNGGVALCYRPLPSFQPFSVGMLAVEQGEDTSHVDCWMDIRKGAFPQVTTF